MVSPELPYRKVHWWLLFTCSVVSNSLQPHGLQHARLPCPSLSPRVCSNSSSRWWHPTISSSVVPFSSRLHSFPASGSFLMSQFFTSGGQWIGVSASASVLPMNIQDWFPLGWTAWISLPSRDSQESSPASTGATSWHFTVSLSKWIGQFRMTEELAQVLTWWINQGKQKGDKKGTLRKGRCTLRETCLYSFFDLLTLGALCINF